MDLGIIANQSGPGRYPRIPNVPPGKDWLLVSNSKVVDDGLEILSVFMRPVGGLDQRLIAASLTTDIVSDLLY